MGSYQNTAHWQWGILEGFGGSQDDDGDDDDENDAGGGGGDDDDDVGQCLSGCRTNHRQLTNVREARPFATLVTARQVKQTSASVMLHTKVEKGQFSSQPGNTLTATCKASPGINPWVQDLSPASLWTCSVLILQLHNDAWGARASESC